MLAQAFPHKPLNLINVMPGTTRPAFKLQVVHAIRKKIWSLRKALEICNYPNLADI